MAKYNFYRNIDKKLHPINKEYSFILDQYHLYDLLMNKGWIKKTCAPRLQKYWSKSNKTVGQCSITSFLVQDIFGGEVYGVSTKSGIHCFNKVNDMIFDLTSEQFNGLDKIKEYPLDNLQSRIVHFKKIEKYNRYLLLKKNIEVK